MEKTVYEYLNEAKDVLNSMKPFSAMKADTKISVIYRVRTNHGTTLKADIVTYPWKAALGFDFYDYFTLNSLKVDDVPIKDCIFRSIEIVDNGLVIECSAGK